MHKEWQAWVAMHQRLWAFVSKLNRQRHRSRQAKLMPEPTPYPASLIFGFLGRAAEVFDIPPERQNRISVRRIGKGEK
jgi:hypothetical protein